MAIRFKDKGNLFKVVQDCYLRTLPKETSSLKQHIYLLENGDLSIDDDFDTESSGIFLKVMRVHDYFEEDAEVVIPRKLKHQSLQYS